jgi:potassium channel LctB
MPFLLMSAVIICMALSLRELFIPSRWKYKKLSFENFLLLGLLYVTIMIGFALLYLLLDMQGYAILAGKGMYSGSFLERLHTSLYFSGITLFTVGYGDLVPSGIGRWIALVEAWLGYTIPAAFVVKTFIDWEK